MGDRMLDPSFRGTTESPHIEDGITVGFPHRLPDRWDVNTTVYVVLSSGVEVTFTNEDNETTEIFDFHPTDWANLHANLVRLNDTTARIEIIGPLKNPAVDLAPPEL